MAQDIEITGGVYIVRRHAQLLASGKKSLIVKGVNFSDLVGRSLYAVSKNEVYAIIKLKKPEEISREDFDKRREEHQTTEKEQLAWYPYASKLYAYKFDVLKVFDPPLTYTGKSNADGVVGEVKIEKVFMAKIPMDELSPKKVQEMTDHEVNTLHTKLHLLYENAPHENSIEDVLSAHILAISEMRRRSIRHGSTDELDNRTQRYEDEILTKMGVGVAESPNPVAVDASTSAYNYSELYKEMGIDTSKLGCIMLNTEVIPNHIPENLLYVSPDPIDTNTYGFVADKEPHVTLLFGLMESGVTWQKYVEELLGDRLPKSIHVTGVGFFESLKDEPYYCIVAFIDSMNLMETHQKLQFLPHVDTFPNYIPHVTIAYIKKDDGYRDIIVAIYNKMLAGKELYVTGLNFGDAPVDAPVTLPYVGRLESLTHENSFFRKILFTSNNSQLVLMSVKPNEDIGEEVHTVDQFFRVEEGIARAVLNGKEYLVTPGDAVVVPAHTYHNFINISDSKAFKVYTIYAPPEHPADEAPILDKPKEQAPTEEKTEGTQAEDRDSYPVTPSPRSIFSAQHKHYAKDDKKKKIKGEVHVRGGGSVGTMETGTTGTYE